jgi:hypothetical protein
VTDVNGLSIRPNIISRSEYPTKWGKWLTTISRRHVLPGLLLLVLSRLVYWPFAERMTAAFGDFTIHVGWAKAMAESGVIPQPHFLFHALLIGLKAIVPSMEYELAGHIVLAAALSLTTAVVYGLLCGAVPEAGGVRDALGRVMLSFGVVLAGPIHLFTLRSGNIYLGYIAPNGYHSPTLLVSKPFSIALFWLVACSLSNGNLGVAGAAGVGVLTILSALGKPSYVMCLVPALALWMAGDLWAGRRPSIGLCVAGVGVGAAVMGWQYQFVWGGGAALTWAPLVVMSHYSDHLLFKFVMSTLFPFTVLLAIPNAHRDTALRLAWIQFAVGCVFQYCLMERGGRGFDGNLMWSAQITLAILLVASLRVLLQCEGANAREATHAGKTLAWCVFSWHVLSGLVSYALNFTQSPFR